jgi:hypothetical protein
MEERLKNLSPGSGVALWITPFRELLLTIFSEPVDLIHLDQNYVVLNTIESFPISTSGASGISSSSMLILSTQAIASTGVQIGDQLILCSPDEMHRRINQLHHEEVRETLVPVVVHDHSGGLLKEVPLREDRTNEPRNFLNTQDAAARVPVPEYVPEENASPEAASTLEDSPSEPVGEERQVFFSKKKSWWRRFLAGDPPDARKAEREPIPGLVAYFFTGSAPVPHQVRDISTNGLYVITEERWYRDTVIRVTLSDQRDPAREISLTLHARAARSGADGVGLQFFLFEKKDLERNSSLKENDPAMVVTKDQLEDFVKRFKASRR